MPKMTRAEALEIADSGLEHHPARHALADAILVAETQKERREAVEAQLEILMAGLPKKVYVVVGWDDNGEQPKSLAAFLTQEEADAFELKLFQHLNKQPSFDSAMARHKTSKEAYDTFKNEIVKWDIEGPLHKLGEEFGSYHNDYCVQAIELFPNLHELEQRPVAEKNSENF